MMTSSNGNIFRVTGHLCGEFTGPRWIPHTKATDAELWCLLWSAPNKRLSKHSWGWWFETLSSPLWRHCNVLPLLSFYGSEGNNSKVTLCEWSPTVCYLPYYRCCQIHDFISMLFCSANLNISYNIKRKCSGIPYYARLIQTKALVYSYLVNIYFFVLWRVFEKLLYLRLWSQPSLK